MMGNEVKPQEEWIMAYEKQIAHLHSVIADLTKAKNYFYDKMKKYERCAEIIEGLRKEFKALDAVQRYGPDIDGDADIAMEVIYPKPDTDDYPKTNKY